MRAPVDAVGHQEVAHRIGPPRAQGEVVFAGAALVAIAFDAHLHRRILVQPLGLAGEESVASARIV